MNNEYQKKILVDELHKQARRNFKRRRVITKGIDDLSQADLVEMGNYEADNNNYRYLLTVIDTFSKYAWAVPLKTKRSLDVKLAMEKIFVMGRIPKNLQTDDGKEFFNTNFKELMHKNHINHYSTYSVLKASIIERFNRTLKSMMWKQFSLQGSYQWINNYDELIKEYNNKIHRTIKMTPNEVNYSNEKQILKTAFNNLKIFNKPKFRIGDDVRISKYKHTFEKGYTPNWTTEIFKIKTIQNTNPITYILQDYEGNVIKGGFYEYELSKTKFPNVYLIERVLERKGNSIYVKWLAFSNKHNEWINTSEIV